MFLIFINPPPVTLGNSAVNADILSGNPPGLFAAQKSGHIGNIFNFSQSSQSSHLRKSLYLFGGFADSE
jgi:hypothetical protein